MQLFQGTVATKSGIEIPHYPMTLVAIGGVLAASLEAFGPILPEPYSRWAGAALAALTGAAVWSTRIRLIYHTLTTRNKVYREVAADVTPVGTGYVSFDAKVTPEDVARIKSIIQQHLRAKPDSQVSTLPAQGTTSPTGPSTTEDNR